MFVRLRQPRRLARDQFRRTLEVVDPERQAWEIGDCVVQVDLSDGPNAHRSLARGPLEPALDLHRLSRDEPPATAESRLLWEMGRAVDSYVGRIFDAGIICPFRGEPKDEAAEYPDGWGVYAWQGQEVSERLISRPETVTVAEALGEANIEIRRIMLERMGYARFILESGARPVHAAEAGTLDRIDLPREWPLTLVHVANATPEPDGSVRRYFLRVPPRMRRARQAVGR